MILHPLEAQIWRFYAQQIFFENLLPVRPNAKNLTNISLFNPHNSLVR